ncbi:MAG: hypothetical protein ABIA47_01685 [bacterium]
MIRALTIALIVIGIGLAGVFAFAQMGGESSDEAVAAVVDLVLEDREAVLIKEGSPNFGNENEINILLLGLDARKSESEPHCDAIHMFTLDIEAWTVHVTSVPRGTYAYIPPGTYEVGEYYLANACAYAGLDYGIGEIEKIVGVKADYVATVGFSQVLGLARLFDMPTTETLEWLRHRQSYQIGEPQRTHNQAVFIKDMIISQLGRFESDMSIPLQYLAFKMVDTDMDFATARTLMQGFIDSGIDERPDDIVLTMEPHYETVDIHFDVENAESQIKELMDYIAPLLGEGDFSGRSLEEIQSELEVFVQARLAGDDSISELYKKRIWLQVEDDELREEFHFEFVQRYVEEIAGDDPEAAIDVVSEYILEKSTLGFDDATEQGRELLGSLISQ